MNNQNPPNSVSASAHHSPQYTTGYYSQAQPHLHEVNSPQPHFAEAIHEVAKESLSPKSETKNSLSPITEVIECVIKKMPESTSVTVVTTMENKEEIISITRHNSKNKVKKEEGAIKKDKKFSSNMPKTLSLVSVFALAAFGGYALFQGKNSGEGCPKV